MDSLPQDNNFSKALGFAMQWHKGQVRKGTRIPYLSHLLGVASIALEFGATDEEAVAALLHDALEDGPEYSGQDAEALANVIDKEFGPEVARLVLGATDAQPKAGEAKEPWEKRKRKYLRGLAGHDSSALLVSASDKLHNARSILTDVMTAGDSANVEAFFTRFNQGKAGTLQYYRLLVDAYRAAPAVQFRPGLWNLVEELDRTVTAIERACGVEGADVRAYPLLVGALDEGQTEMVAGNGGEGGA